MLSHRNFQEVYEYSGGVVIALDPKGDIVYCNSKATDLIFSGEDPLGNCIADYVTVPGRSAEDVLRMFETELELVDEEFKLRRENVNVKTVLISSKVYTDAAGKMLNYLLVRNITVLKKKENLLAYLNTAAEELAQARDTSSAIEKISRLMVPRFSDWFVIDVLKDGAVDEILLVHDDPEMIHFARSYREAYPIDLNADTGPGRVLKTGIPMFVPVVTRQMTDEIIGDAARLDAVRQMNLQSIIMVPMFNKDVIMGMVSFISSTSGYHYDETDLRFAQNIANHIGMALENARLNEAAVGEIARRKLIALELKKSEEMFRFLADAIPHKLWTSAPDGQATYYNQGWYDYTGISGFDELKTRVWETLHPEDREKASVLWPQTIARGEPVAMEHRFRRYDGQYRWHLSRVSPHKSEDGNIKLWVGTSTDIHEHKTMQEALETSEAHFKALAQFNSQPIWQVNAQSEMVFVNDSWCTFTGVSAERTAEADWRKNVHPDDFDDMVAQFTALFEKREPVHLQYRFRYAPTGEYRWVLDNAHPVFNPSFQGYIGTMTDIHEQEQARLTIQELMGKKDEFISIASHELKTPLTSIKAFNQLMQRTDEPNRVRNFVQKSAGNIARLEKLINDLLDVSRINAGKILYDFEPFPFGTMLTEAVEAARHTSPDHEFELNIADDVTFTGDRFRLEQVVNNFLSNAVKYSPDGKRIIVSSRVELDNIVVSVQDFGIGIEKENLDKLFDRYYRVDNTAMRFEGLGLGLFISSEILQRHQGSFWIESEPGEGSTFYFRLPLRHAPSAARVKQTGVFYKDEHITIEYNANARRMDVDWTGFQDFASVQKGCLLMLDYLKNNKCDRIVNDNTHVLGNWSEAVDWVGNEWFPMMEKAGLKYFAHLFSPSTFSQLSAQKSIDIMAGIVTTQYFTEIALARQWIDNCPR